jgi:hypothetical protein
MVYTPIVVANKRKQDPVTLQISNVLTMAGAIGLEHRRDPFIAALNSSLVQRDIESLSPVDLILLMSITLLKRTRALQLRLVSFFSYYKSGYSETLLSLFDELFERHIHKFTKKYTSPSESNSKSKALLQSLFFAMSIARLTDDGRALPCLLQLALFAARAVTLSERTR